jgi:predicted nucleotidyltransferase
MNGVRVRFLNREQIVSRLAELAQQLLVIRPDVLEVGLFGSLARGNHAPGSDADLYVLLKKDSRRFMDRIPEFLDHFSGVGIPVEVFPYTREEIEKMQGRSFIKSVLRERVVLASRTEGVQQKRPTRISR